MTTVANRPLLLVTGATGYIGGRLLRALLERGARVRCMARRPDEARARLAEGADVVAGDVLDPASLPAALAGVDTAYFLIHAMASARGFAAQELEGAEHFAQAARAAGVRRIVYLGGLGGLGAAAPLSPHLASRHAVGRLLRESGVPTLELRASVIIGSGSLSFELVRALVERLPVLLTPRWVSTRTQPVAVDDVIAYLAAAAEVPMAASTVVEIGGGDRVSYEDLMREYAAQRRLRRLFIRVPVLTPWLSGAWLGLVTPVYARVGRKLIDGVRNETVVTTSLAAQLFPDIRPRGMRDAIAQALDNEDRDIAETRWSDARSSLGTQPWGGALRGSRLVDSRTIAISQPPAGAFRPIEAIGGARGWYYGDWMWRLRGFLDLLAGGAGMRRGRRDPLTLLPGDALDFWRVEAIERGRLLRLRAEMKVPGRAWLQFEVSADGSGSVIRQSAIFEPHGLAGLAYWYALFPVHGLIFGRMLRNIARAAATDVSPIDSSVSTASSA
jgi:uncharacterized protein YbjT (DUF2867 family)